MPLGEANDIGETIPTRAPPKTLGAGVNEMTLSSVVSIVPNNIAFLFGIILLVAGGLVWYALRTKGDVRAEVSHGRTVFKLEAKERKSDRS
jgi:FtsH-binding integral membrane protein